MPLDMPQLSKNKPRIERIAFTGPMCSGKTYLANYIMGNYYGYSKHAFADKLKGLAYELFDVQGKDGNNRLILQQIGSKMREIDPNVWVRYSLRTVKAAEESNKYHRTVIDDLRYINEATWLRANNFTIIRVETDENIRLARIATLYPNTPSRASVDASEQEWKAIVPDFTINSNNLDALLDLGELISEELTKYDNQLGVSGKKSKR